ncbi:MAG: PilN domain-containing protein [Pseudobdellovibrionaceae bacterium]
MIKVNLLTQAIAPTGGTTLTSMGANAEKEDGDLAGVSPAIRNQALSKILMMMMPIFGMYAYSGFYNLPALQSQLSQLSAEAASLGEYNSKNQGLTDEITKIKQDQASIGTRIKTIQEISGRRFDEIKFIEALQQMMVERVFLSNIVYRQGKVNITGYGETTKDVIDFQDQLQKSALLRDVILVQQNDEALNEQTVKRFEMTFRLEENL